MACDPSLSSSLVSLQEPLGAFRVLFMTAGNAIWGSGELTRRQTRWANLGAPFAASSKDPGVDLSGTSIRSSCPLPCLLLKNGSIHEALVILRTVPRTRYPACSNWFVTWLAMKQFALVITMRSSRDARGFLSEMPFFETLKRLSTEMNSIDERCFVLNWYQTRA